MKIKYRITLLYSLLVAGIMLIFCLVIYFLSEYNRENEFRNRLRYRSLTTARILSQIREIDKDLLRRIDESTLVALDSNTIQVFDRQNHLEYSYSDQVLDTATVANEILQSAREKSEQFFKTGRREGIALTYQDGPQQYVVVTQAYDRTGFVQMRQLRWLLISSFLIGLILVVGTGYYFSKKLVKPISNIIDEVNDISSQDLSKRIPTGEGEDELNQLSKTFNLLLERLEESFNIQRRFISNASHELSTPLASISSQLEVSLQKDRATEDYKSVMHSIYEDVQQLGKLTRSLLEMAKSGSEGGIELHEIRLDEILIRLPEEIRKVNPEFTVELQFSEFPESENECLIFGNADLLYSALKNIIDNACKYSPDKKAEVNLSFSEGWVKVEILDNGKGISKEELDSVFQPFYRGRNEESGSGFGLGLSMASRIIRLHRGKIEVRSELEKGTLFSVWIPSVSVSGS